MLTASFGRNTYKVKVMLSFHVISPKEYNGYLRLWFEGTIQLFSIRTTQELYVVKSLMADRVTARVKVHPPCTPPCEQVALDIDWR